MCFVAGVLAGQGSEGNRGVWEAMEWRGDSGCGSCRGDEADYGKAAAQALTPDNQVAELYDPAVSQDETQLRKRCKGVIKGFRILWWWIRRCVRAIRGLGGR